MLLAGGLVVPLDRAGTRPAAYDVLIRDGRVAALFPRDAGPGEHPDAAARRAAPDAPVVDCSGRIILPGLVNAHLHPELHLVRGLVEGLSLHEWPACVPLQRALDALEDPATESIQRAAVRAALAECALAGASTIVCYGVSPRVDAIAAQELAALGLNGWTTIRDVAFAPRARAARPHMYRIHAEEALDEAELRAAAVAHERGEWLIMHVAETRERVAIARRTFGTTPIRLLGRYGLLSPRVLLSHAVYVDDEEIDLIAEAGAAVLASPVAESKLADGLAPVAAMHRAGVRVALGTDAAVCNNSCDLLLEARMLGLLQRLDNGAATLPAERLLRFATVEGAAVLDSPAAAGIAPGAPADLVLLDATAPHMLPLVHRPELSNLFANIVFSGTGRDVTDLMVEGRWVVRERRLVAGDVARIGADLASAAEELIQRTERMDVT
ncbi:MAG TPA: amidohydrolase family protein [Longimicrobiales bacterium]